MLFEVCKHIVMLVYPLILLGLTAIQILELEYYDFLPYDELKLETGKEYSWKHPEKVTKNRQKSLRI